MKVLITGAAGFLGKTLVRYFVRQGCFVVGLDIVDRPAIFSEYSNLSWIRSDYKDINFSSEELESINDSDCLIHLASSSVPLSSVNNISNDCYDNVFHSINFFEYVLDHTSIDKIIFSSSGGAVYGDVFVNLVSETIQENPISAYGASKLAIEKYLSVLGRERSVKTISLRLSNPYGEFQNPRGVQGIVGIFARKICEGEAISIWGDGSAVRDYIDAEDVASAFHKAACNICSGNVFNIGSGCGYSINQVIAILEEELGRKAIVNYERDKGFNVGHIVLDCRLARKELHWQSTANFNEGVRRFLNKVGFVRSSNLKVLHQL